MHPDLRPIIERRCAGKEPDDWLFDDLPERGNGHSRGDAESTAFGRYLRRLGLEDMRPGRRRSLINFHSFRRWFVTKAEEAGFQENLVAAVVGHRSGKAITFGVYSRADLRERMKAVVEAVKLPQHEEKEEEEEGEED